MTYSPGGKITRASSAPSWRRTTPVCGICMGDWLYNDPFVFTRQIAAGLGIHSPDRKTRRYNGNAGLPRAKNHDPCAGMKRAAAGTRMTESGLTRVADSAA